MTNLPGVTNRRPVLTSNPDFVGRSGILEQPRSQLRHGPHLTDGTSQPRMSIHGLVPAGPETGFRDSPGDAHNSGKGFEGPVPPSVHDSGYGSLAAKSVAIGKLDG